jgi:hypothetical protein
MNGQPINTSASSHLPKVLINDGPEYIEFIPNKAPAGQWEIDQQYITHAEAEQMVRNIRNVVRNYVDKGCARVEKKIQEAENEVKNIRQTQQWCTDPAIKPYTREGEKP